MTDFLKIAKSRLPLLPRVYSVQKLLVDRAVFSECNGPSFIFFL